MLKSLVFSELRGTPRAWNLEEIGFSQINLLVGKNASGKTRILNVLNGFADLLCRRRASLYETGDYDFVFSSPEGDLRYKLRVSDHRVVAEQLTRGKRVLLDRTKGGFGKIYAVQSKRPLEFQTPDDQLALVARQDSIQHPYLSEIIEWAGSVVHYKFGTDFGKQNLFVRRVGKKSELDIKNTDMLAPFFIDGFETLGAKFKKSILADMSLVGYDLDDIGVRVPEGISLSAPLEGPLENLFVKERGVETPIDQVFMSQGMFRAMSLVVQVNYAILSKKPYCLLIDDIGEGLDFDRSTALIELLVRKYRSSNDQLIMTTNDRFVMNGVPLEYWTVIERVGHRVKSTSASTSPKKFKDFQYTGLSNFDFFASRYLER